MARRDGTRRPELIFLLSASAGGYNAGMCSKFQPIRPSGMIEAPPKSSNCPLNAQRMPVSEPARTNPSPTAADAIEDEVQEALAICGGDAIAALRITLIANAFLEAEVDRL